MNENMKNDMLNWVIANKIKSQYILVKIGSFLKEYGYTIIDFRNNKEIYEWVYNYVKKNEQIQKDFE